MGIMDMFRTAVGGNTQPQQGQQGQQQNNGPAQPGNLPSDQQKNPAMQGTGAVPNNAVTNPAENSNENVSPLDKYSDFWKNEGTKQNKGNEPLFNIDPKKLQEAAAQNDFSRVISPEILQKIQAGGEEAIAATLTAMNQMTQSGYAQSALATTKIVEAALQKQAAAFKAELPSIIKQHQFSDKLNTENPVFQHPAAAPMLESLKAQVLQKHPNATTEEQTRMAKEFLVSFAEHIAGTANPNKSQGSGKSTKETDWSTFLE